MKDPKQLGTKVRRLRLRKEMSQAELARRLAISASYLNLIEHNQRGLTVPLLLKLAREFEIDLESFDSDEEERLAGELADVFADPLFEDQRVDEQELEDLALHSPSAAKSVLKLYRAWRRLREEARALPAEAAAGAPGVHSSRLANEEVSDLFQQRDNHIAELEQAAENLSREQQLDVKRLAAGLEQALSDRHGVSVEVAQPGQLAGAVRRYDPKSKRLLLSEVLTPASLKFQLAHQVGILELGSVFDEAIGKAGLKDPATVILARVALANYFAGAVCMPYGPFLKAARETRYDIELLEHRFRASFEQVCHRLSTLNRPGNSGVPLHFVRIDIAGNVSKRFSKSGIRFSRTSGSCPRWNVHGAFLTPGAIRIQRSRMPDGSTFFCVARTLRKAGGGHRMPQSRLAIGLGCEMAHAGELVYSDGLDLSDDQAIVPIGIACRLCDRTDCRQRAFPPIHTDFEVDVNVRGPNIYTTPGG